MPLWRNGKRSKLKPCPKIVGAGSSPARGTKNNNGVIMKKLTITLIAALMGTAVYADSNFENSQAFLQFETGPVYAKVEGNSNLSFTDVEVGGSVWEAPINDKLSYNVVVYGRYFNELDRAGLGAKYFLNYEANAATLVYGELNVLYLSTELVDYSLGVNPRIGVAYDASELVGLFGELGYTWGADDDFSTVGGRAEAGVDFNVSEAVSIPVSVVYYFDTPYAEDNAQLRVGVDWNF